MIVAGLMSGTSLDGLDIAVCRFWTEDGGYRFELLQAETKAYSEAMTQQLQDCHQYSAEQFIDFHREYGRFLGESVRDACAKHSLRPEAIASHGHTIFHEPFKGRNFQLGDGAALASAACLPVVMDFRSQDVCLGGQGAPLVPVGDDLLFAEYYYRLNLGGFSNLSFRSGDELVAYDICPFNLVLNALANRRQLAFDEGGSIARQGIVDMTLLDRMNGLGFYQQKPPKSLGREWLEREIMPLINDSKLSVPDLLATFNEHAAIQIAHALPGGSGRKVLITGGGAFNSYFLERLKVHTPVVIALPAKDIIEFKEAIIFAFLAYLRLQGIENINNSVTGATKKSVAGAIYQGKFLEATELINKDFSTVFKYFIQFFSDYQLVGNITQQTKRRLIRHNIFHACSTRNFAEQMLVVPDAIWTNPLFINKIRRLIYMSNFSYPFRLIKREGPYAIGYNHSRIHFFGWLISKDIKSHGRRSNKLEILG